MQQLSKILPVIHHSRNFLHILAMLSTFITTCFQTLDAYNQGPSREDQETWISLELIAAAIFLTSIAGYADARQAKVDPEKHLGTHEYICTMLSPPLSFYFWYAVSGKKEMPLAWFVSLSALFWLISLPVLLKWFVPEVSNKVTCFWNDDDLAKANQVVIAVDRKEQWVNAVLRIGIPTVFSLALLMNTFLRENSGKEEMLTLLECEALFAAFIASVWLVGRRAASHPNLAFVYLALMKMCESFAWCIKALSGLFSSAAVYFACGGKKYCADATAEVWLTQASILFSSVCALYSSATHFPDAKKRHEENLLLFEKVEAARNFCGEIKNRISAGFQYAADGIKSLCQKAENRAELQSLTHA
ncbi:MAG: hypothetical protein A3E84_04960 [Gammaproteobacteria bacterium RIFCSPHIGHO2_12_FULL_42_13]|nr:MAG: hypothetical protein A3E84_04960 [Gammaproteobacteria bacterium RIFCSPHIGHO2_12_FULL_42_13]